MYCRTRENFTTGDTTVGDVDPQENKNIMLTDAKGNISLVKFSDTITKLQKMINALNVTVEKNNATQAKMIEDLSDSVARAVMDGDKINMKSRFGLFLNNCGSDPNAPCRETIGGTAHYVSAYDKDPEGSKWTINKS